MIRRPPRSTLFPTRRSSDLLTCGVGLYQLSRGVPRSTVIGVAALVVGAMAVYDEPFLTGAEFRLPYYGDVSYRSKSTRLNSSHSQISYAVFCLKKKKKSSIS